MFKIDHGMQQALAYAEMLDALTYLPEVAGCANFINTDLIAAELSPLAPNR